jgi:acyl-CoA synthetase (NDP forming)
VIGIDRTMAHPHLAQLLAPSSLAIVGANDKGNVGARALKIAIAMGFPGAIYPVNPNYESLQGLPCYPSLAQLPIVPDAVAISVPIGGALAVLGEAADAGIPSAVMFSEGFADAGTAAGASRHEALRAIVARSGMAICGPNCAGLFSLQRRYAATFTNLPAGLLPGGISIVSQSGGLINALLELGRNRQLGFNYVISSGNETVVTGADYLDWLAEDNDTKVIIAIIEGIKDGARLRDALTRASGRKPVLVLKLGRSDGGKRATLAHTGSLAGRDDAFRALCRQCGALLCDTLDQLLESAAMFTTLPLPRGDRIVLFSTSGGATVLTTDLAAASGLNFPPLTQATNDALQEILAVERPFTNPFDVVGAPRLVKGSNMTRCLQTILADDSVDLVGCVLVVPRDATPQRQTLLDQVKSVLPGTDKPVLLLSEATAHWRDWPADAGTHVGANLQDGLIGIRHLIDYAAYRRRPPATMPLAPTKLVLPRRAGCAVLTEFESKRVLANAGFPITREDLVHSAEGAVTAASRIGYPVALKLQSPDLMHKSDVGGLRLGLSDDDSVRGAYAALVAAHQAREKSAPLDGVLVQEMVDGIELMLGMLRDPVLGPVVVLGPGGVFVELFEHASALRLAPFGRDEAERMLEESPAACTLIKGFRGRKRGDRAALVALVADFADFVARLDESVVAIDLNPVMVLPEGHGVRIVDAAIEFAC